MRNLSVGIVFPLVLLAALLGIGTGEGTVWEKNLRHQGDRIGIDDRLSSISARQSGLVKDYEGQWERHGLTIEPGAGGYATFAVPKASGAESISVRVWAYDFGECSVKWWGEEGAASPKILSAKGDLVGKIYRIAPPSNERVIILQVSGRNDTSQPQVLVDRLIVSSGPFNPLKGWTAAFWVWGAITALWLGFAARMKWWAPPGGMMLWCSALLLLLIGGSLRLNLLSVNNGVPLDPDVVAYQGYAERFQWFSADRGFYSASFGEREPLWVVIIKLWQTWMGTGDLAVRLLTSVLSVSVVAATGVFLWRLLKKGIWVVLGMALVAFNPSLIEESCRGLRSEAMTLGFIAFLMLSFKEGDRGFRPVAGGILVGLWALLRSPALGIAFGAWAGLWGMGFLSKYRNVRLSVPRGFSLPRVSLAVGIALLLFIPHLFGFERRYGDWRWPSYGYARWNANMEFPERVGTPGFPSAEEFKKSPYAGPRISYGEYIFGLHTPFQVIKYQFFGWVEMIGYQALSLSPQSLKLAIKASTGNFSGMVHSLSASLILAFFLGIAALAGGLKLLVERNLWWAPLMVFWGTYYAAFLFHVRLVEPIRHAAHVYPLTVLLTVGGIRWVWEGPATSRAREYVRHRWFQE